MEPPTSLRILPPLHRIEEAADGIRQQLQVISDRQLRIGDTVELPNTPFDGRKGVIIGYEIWTSDNDTVVYNGVAIERLHKTTGHLTAFPGGPSPRYRIYVEDVGGLESSIQRHCVRQEDATGYPFCSYGSVKFLHGPEGRCFNDSGEEGSWFFIDVDGNANTLAGSDAEGRYRIAVEKRRQFRLKQYELKQIPIAPREPGNRTLNFRCQEVLSTKIAKRGDLHVGFKFMALSLMGYLELEVTSIDGDSARATTPKGSTGVTLEQREDGWYDLHIRGNLDGIQKLTFGDATTPAQP